MSFLTLPMPPSSNRYWRYVKGRVLVSAEAKAWRATAETLAKMQRPTCIRPGTPAAVRLIAYFERNNRDLDNTLKIALDLLAGICYANDKQIVRIEAAKMIDKHNPRIEITVEAA